MDEKLLMEATPAMELLDLHLYTCSLERADCDYDIFSPEIKKNQKNSAEINADIFEPIEKTEDSFQLLNIKVSLKVALYNQENQEKPLYTISACFLAKYVQRYELNENALKEFIQFNSLHNIWPFWREHALRVASLANLPKPQIQLMRLNNLKENASR